MAFRSLPRTLMRPLSLYIHVPFCTRRCSYCSFYHVPAARDREHAFVDALLDEIAVAREELGTLALRSIFVGGGTPTVLARGEWERIMGLRDRKGGDPSEWPEDLRVREFPRAA